MGSDAHIEEIKRSGPPNIVCVVSAGGRRVGEKDDYTVRRELVLRFASFAPATGDQELHKQQAINRSEKILMDFANRIERLYDEFFDGQLGDDDLDCDNIAQYLEPDKISWREIEDQHIQPWLVNHYGWDLSIPIKAPMQQYDPAVWFGGAGGAGGQAPTQCPLFSTMTAPSSADTIGVPITDNGATEYRVQLLAISDEVVLQEKIVVKQPGVPPGTSFTGLRNNTPFRIRVSAKVDNAFSNTCAAPVVYTPAAPACEVVQLTPGTNQVRVYWLGNNSSYLRIVTLFADAEGTETVESRTVHAGAVGYEVLFEDLQPDTDYWVRVQPADRNTGGDDNLCDLHQTKTL
ncbi:MAG: hypothetical protein EOP84_02065 [Verrucomicrobiaceae bacterium]|nr:MAG: hypothetical protein EOP84_02065 [Verrucomicrobiaceae bacterium]